MPDPPERRSKRARGERRRLEEQRFRTPRVDWGGMAQKKFHFAHFARHENYLGDMVLPDHLILRATIHVFPYAPVRMWKYR